MAGWPDWVTGLQARARSMYRGLTRHAEVELEMREEFRHHLAERADDLVRSGLSRDEAERRARLEFGHQGTHRAEAQGAMGLASIARLRVSWLDVKYAFRLLRKYPMLNLAAVFAFAVGIPMGLAPSHIARALEAPLPEIRTIACARFDTGTPSPLRLRRPGTTSSRSGPGVCAVSHPSVRSAP